jgi:hypothetical protein
MLANLFQGIMPFIMALWGLPASAQTLPTVVDQDLLDAGYSRAEMIEPESGRYRAPILYFRVNEGINDSDAKKDCPDCGSLVAVYVGQPKSVPSWSARQKTSIQKVGGRWQSRNYLPETKTVIIVTGPVQDYVKKLAEITVTKSGQ